MFTFKYFSWFAEDASINPWTDLDFGYKVTSSQYSDALKVDLPTSKGFDLSETSYKFDKSRLRQLCGKTGTSLAVLVDPYNLVKESNKGNNRYIVDAHLENCEGRSLFF